MEKNWRKPRGYHGPDWAVRAIIQQAAGEALNSDQVAARFRRTKASKVKPLLDTLAMMSQVRYLEPQGTYAA